MAAMMTCPLCGQQHPETSTYCTTLWTEIPAPAEPVEAEPDTEELDPSIDIVTCPECGDQGTAGTECRQCGKPLPVARPLTARAGTMLLPSGARVSVPAGREIIVGRQSDIPEIRQGLEPFDVVSRRHCFITIALEGDRVSVRDPGSVNHTWVGDDPAEVRPDETRIVPLPVRLRLGQHLSITVSAQGVGA